MYACRRTASYINYIFTGKNMHANMRLYVLECMCACVCVSTPCRELIDYVNFSLGNLICAQTHACKVYQLQTRKVT